MSTLQPVAPSGSVSLELVQNLAQVLSASSQSRDEELGKVFSTFQALLQEVKEDLTANAKEIAALKANITTLESEKKQLTLTIASEKQAFASLQSLVSSHDGSIRSLCGSVSSLQGTVNADHGLLHADHAFLYNHKHYRDCSGAYTGKAE